MKNSLPQRNYSASPEDSEALGVIMYLPEFGNTMRSRAPSEGCDHRRLPKRVRL